MKNTKKCPKCRSARVVRFDGSVGPYAVGSNIMVGATVMSAVNVNRYVCCDCGFVEHWVDTKDLQSISDSKKAKK